MNKRKNRILKCILSFVCVFTILPAVNAIIGAEEYEVIDDTDARFVYSAGDDANNGGWESAPGDEPKVSEHWSNSAGATLDVNFNGTKLELYGKAAPDHAMFSVSIDGEEAQEVDAYASKIDREKKLYESDTLEAGDHVARITVLKKRNPSSTGTGKVYGVQFVYAKAFESEPGFEGYSIIEDMDTTSGDEFFKIKYIGAWGGGTGYYPDRFHDGYEHYADAGASFEMRFTGTKFEMWATKASNHGQYDVYIDGEKIGVADASSATTIDQQNVYTSPELEDGEHLLKIMLPETSSKSIQLDYLKVYHSEVAPDSIKLNMDNVRLQKGLTKQVKATVYPSVAANKKVVWTSADEDIATVDKNGTITAVSNEEATTKVTATVKGTEIKADVTVNVIEGVEFMSAFVGSTDLLNTQDDYDDILLEDNSSWKDTAWKGDVLNSKIVTVTRSNDIHNAEIVASDFTNGNDVIDAKNVDAKWLKNVKANIGRGSANAPVKDFPDVIHKGGKLDIDAATVQSAWLNINVPKDAKPGVYKGTISVKADELKEDYVFDYEFEVLDLLLPSSNDTGLEVQVWQHPFAVANYYKVDEDDYFTEKHYQYMRESMKEYKSIGGVDVVANVVEEAWNHQSYTGDPSMVKWTKKADGTFAFDYTWYDSWIDFQIECGVLDPQNGIGQIKCYSIVPWNNQIAYFDEASGSTVKKSFKPGSADWNEIWSVFLEDFMDHSKEKGWFDMTYISMDERGINDLKHAVNVIESVVDEAGKSFKISSAFNYGEATGDYEFTDHIDDISIGMIYVPDDNDEMRDLSAHRKAQGLTTTIYTCTGHYPGNFTISDPGDNYWVMWYSLSHGTDGFMRWAWDNYVEDPLTNVTYKYWEPGDGWFIYPTEKGEVSDTYFYSTPRYEMLKQGVRDVNKAKYLMNTSTENADTINALLHTMVRPESGGNGFGSAVAKNEIERMLTFSETARMKAGLNDLAKAYLNNAGIPVENITVDMNDVTLFEKETMQVTATVTPENASDKSLLWSSNDETVATVKDGLITAVKEGETVIVVTSADESVRAEIKVTVKKGSATEPEKPTDPDVNQGSDVETKDTTNLGLWVSLLMVGACTVLFVVNRNKKLKKN